MGRVYVCGRRVEEDGHQDAGSGQLESHHNNPAPEDKIKGEIRTSNMPDKIKNMGKMHHILCPVTSLTDRGDPETWKKCHMAYQGQRGSLSGPPIARFPLFSDESHLDYWSGQCDLQHIGHTRTTRTRQTCSRFQRQKLTETTQSSSFTWARLVGMT